MVQTENDTISTWLRSLEWPLSQWWSDELHGDLGFMKWMQWVAIFEVSHPIMYELVLSEQGSAALMSSCFYVPNVSHVQCSVEHVLPWWETGNHLKNEGSTLHLWNSFKCCYFGGYFQVYKWLESGLIRLNESNTNFIVKHRYLISWFGFIQYELLAQSSFQEHLYKFIMFCLVSYCNGDII